MPDQRPELIARRPHRDGYANDNILRPGMPLKQHLKGRQQGHEERAAFARARNPQFLRHCRRKVEEDV